MCDQQEFYRELLRELDRTKHLLYRRSGRDKHKGYIDVLMGPDCVFPCCDRIPAKNESRYVRIFPEQGEIQHLGCKAGDQWRTPEWFKNKLVAEFNRRRFEKRRTERTKHGNPLPPTYGVSSLWR